MRAVPEAEYEQRRIRQAHPSRTVVTIFRFGQRGMVMHHCPNCNRVVFRKRYADWQKPIVTYLHRRPYLCLNEGCHWQGWLHEEGSTPPLNSSYRL